MTERIHKNKVLIISHDKIGSSMAGPGIRYHYMAEVLSRIFDVTVGFFDPTYLPEVGFNHSYQTRSINVHNFEADFKDFDTVIAHWLSEAILSYCNNQNSFLVFDLYVPGPVENLAGKIFSGKSAGPEDDFEYNRALSMYKKFLENGDLFLFSNRRQLDFWTGFVFGANQIHLSTYPKRPLYERFIYAPMGIDTSIPLDHSEKVMKGVTPGINDTDKVLLWTGGIWNHFDGQTLMRAMKLLQVEAPDIKLVFLGTQHPNPNVPEMKESLDTRELAKELGIINKNVFFKDGWVKYSERINYLLEADVAINTHKASIETEFSHRTRVLDHLLAGLPTISTEGDYLADEVIKARDLGYVVPANNVMALKQAILRALSPKELIKVNKNIQSSRKDFDWKVTMKSLESYLESSPRKLNLLRDAQPLMKRGKTVRVAKRFLPTPVKKAIIRTLRIK